MNARLRRTSRLLDIRRTVESARRGEFASATIRRDRIVAAIDHLVCERDAPTGSAETAVLPAALVGSDGHEASRALRALASGLERAGRAASLGAALACATVRVAEARAALLSKRSDRRRAEWLVDSERGRARRVTAHRAPGRLKSLVS
jgi:hypothetical protein